MTGVAREIRVHDGTGSDDEAGSIAALVERARALVPALRARADEIDAARCMPDDLIRTLADAGLLGLLRPGRFGGPGLGIEVLPAVASQLARGSGSVAWVWSLLASHEWLLGLFPLEAQAQLLAGGAQPIACAVFQPSGRAEPRTGGFGLSGRWSFASGCDVSEWAILAAGVQGTGRPDVRFCLARMAELEIEDDWFVSGLCGTGSKSLVARDVFVPQTHCLSLRDARAGRAPGAGAHPEWIYRVPLFAGFPLAILAPLLGLADAAVEAFSEGSVARFDPYRMAPVADDALAQHRLAEASASVDAARALILEDLRLLRGRVEAGAPPSDALRVRLRRDHGFAARSCSQAVESLAAASGTQALRDGQPLQRIRRDVHAAAAHVALRSDALAGLYGRVALGRAADTALY